MSPSTPQRGSASSAFAAVKIPWLVMTGTLDSSPIGNASAASRREVFAALPPPSKYELVLDGAEHSAFTDRALPGDKAPRNPNHHRAILALSTAFWDAYLRADGAARTWLDGDGPRTVLEPRDVEPEVAAGWRWQLAVRGWLLAAGRSVEQQAVSRSATASSEPPTASRELPNYRTTELPNYRTTELPN